MSITRVLSAIVLIVIVGGALWLPPVATVVLATVVAALGGFELAKLARPLGVDASPGFVALSAAAFCLVISAKFPAELTQLDALVALLIGLTIAAGLVTLARIPPGPPVFFSIAVTLLAGLYIGLPLGSLAWVRDAHGREALIWLVGVIMLSDSAQYYAGTLMGRRKLAPIVSPKKTVEGAIGGLVIAPIAGEAIGITAFPDVSPIVLAALAVGLTLFGIAGDLFESLLKRSVGAKDSSQLIPGHGGILDRIDAYLFAAPLFYLFLRHIVTVRPIG